MAYNLFNYHGNDGVVHKGVLRKSFEMVGNLYIYTEHAKPSFLSYKKNFGLAYEELRSRYQYYYNVFSNNEKDIYKHNFSKPAD